MYMYAPLIRTYEVLSLIMCAKRTKKMMLRLTLKLMNADYKTNVKNDAKCDLNNEYK